MAAGVSATVSDAFLDGILNASGNISWVSYGPVYVKLHVGSPGATGTANPAGETTRESAGSNPAFTTPSAGSATNSNAITWTSVNTAETYTYVSLWSAATNGTFIASGSITANSVQIGDNFTIPVSDLTVSQTVAS